LGFAVIVRTLGTSVNVIALVLVGIALTSCQRPFVEGFYPSFRAAPIKDAQPVVLFRLRDTRQLSTFPRMFVAEGHHHENATLPVSDGITRALRRALEARGVPVVDASAPRGRLGLRGAVEEFWLTSHKISERNWFPDMRYDARCALSVQLYDLMAETELWRMRTSEKLSGMDRYKTLADALRITVENIVDDIEFQRLITSFDASGTVPHRPA